MRGYFTKLNSACPSKNSETNVSATSPVWIVGILVLGFLFVVALAAGLAVFIVLTRQKRHSQAGQLSNSGTATNASTNPYDPGQLRSGTNANWLPAVIAVVSVLIGLLVLSTILFALFLVGWSTVKVSRPVAPPTPAPPIMVEPATEPVLPIEN